MGTIYFVPGDSGDCLIHILYRSGAWDDSFDVAMCGVVVMTDSNDRPGSAHTEDGIDSDDLCIDCCETVGRQAKNERGGLRAY